MACVRCYVSGRVQGVFFRASTRERARSLGLAGEVSNLPDGRVAVTASGSQAALDDVQCEACTEEPGFSRFEIT